MRVSEEMMEKILEIDFMKPKRSQLELKRLKMSFFSDLGQFKYGLQTTELFTKGNSDILDWGAPIVANCRL